MLRRLPDWMRRDIAATDPGQTVLFPEMDEQVEVPEITTACWGILHKSPEQVMCASSRMVVKRKGAARPAVVACTLLPYDAQFELGETLAEAEGAVQLNHPHCAKFCVLGGARAADGTKKNHGVESTIHATNGVPPKRAHGVILM